ncbi:hypothetical protein [Halopenitus persicus]|uniref:hypothetical protein n=1 Tax=Halopenitus persicus TaxID=1048396 RepID=UPI000BBA8EE6|nr:hypothetical protein [Halopenitus persicus]
MSDVAEQIEDVHVVVQARNGALETAEVYADVGAALERYSDLSSDAANIKTLLAANAVIEDLDLGV